ncbi:unnamed protein product, partial [Ectocarpus fasciculatus]
MGCRSTAAAADFLCLHFEVLLGFLFAARMKRSRRLMFLCRLLAARSDGARNDDVLSKGQADDLGIILYSDKELQPSAADKILTAAKWRELIFLLLRNYSCKTHTCTRTSTKYVRNRHSVWPSGAQPPPSLSTSSTARNR